MQWWWCRCGLPLTGLWEAAAWFSSLGSSHEPGVMRGAGWEVFCPLCSPPAAPPSTRSSREGIFIDYIVNVLLKFGYPFPAICPWQLPSAEASPPDSQHRSCQSPPHPSSHLTGPGDHLFVGMTSFPHPPHSVCLPFPPQSCP